MTNPVAVVRWPSDYTGRARARARGTPCLLVVDEGAAPPSDCGLDEDWTGAAASAADVARRVATLAARPPTRVALAGSVVARLSDAEIAVFVALAERHPDPVPEVALDALGLGTDVLEGALRGLPRRVASDGYAVVRVRGGVLLALVPAEASARSGARWARRVDRVADGVSVRS
jgi:hypothetical protein